MKMQLRQPRVLVVDDNLEAAELFKIFFDAEGFETRIASNGFDAMSIAEALQPHVVCTDIRMPGMSGLELARQLRQTQYGTKSFIVAISGWSEVQSCNEFLNAGFDQWFSKPLDISDLLVCIRNHLSNVNLTLQ